MIRPDTVLRVADSGLHKLVLASMSMLMLGLALLTASPRASAQAPQERDGVVLYWGVVPAAIAAERHDPGELHGKRLASSGQLHHLVVALFDKATGKRIEDAVVRAELHEIGISDAPAKYLTPIQINGLTSYGQQFSVMRSSYQFRLLVKLPQRPGETEFRIAVSSPHP